MAISNSFSPPSLKEVGKRECSYAEQDLTKYDVYPELEETSKSVSTQRADPLSNTNTQPLKRCGPNG